MEVNAQPGGTTAERKPAKKKSPKKASHKAAAPAAEKDYASVRISAETAAAVNKLAAKLQLKTGTKTTAGDAIAYAVNRASN